MKPTCPPSRRLNPPGASDPKNKAAVAAESCLPTNGSAGEKVKSAETGAEIGFSQNEALHNSSEFGKLNPEAPATGLTTGEQPNPTLGASKRRFTMNERVLELLTGCHAAPEVSSRPPLSVFDILSKRGDAVSHKNNRTHIIGFQAVNTGLSLESSQLVQRVASTRASIQGKTKVIAGVVVEDDGKWLSYPLDRVDFTDEQWDGINPGISQDLSHYNWD